MVKMVTDLTITRWCAACFAERIDDYVRIDV